MVIYKHIAYNPYQRNIQSVIQDAQDPQNLEGSKEWCFERLQPVTEYEWVAIFRKWENEITGTPIPTLSNEEEIRKDERKKIKELAEKYIKIQPLTQLVMPKGFLEEMYIFPTKILKDK